MSQRSHFRTSGDLTLAAGAGVVRWDQLLRITTAGQNLAIILHSDYKSIQFQIRLDGKNMPFLYEQFWRPSDLFDMAYLAKEGICIADYDEINDYYTIIISLPLKWDLGLDFFARNPSAGDIHAVVNVFFNSLAELPLIEPKEDIQKETRIDPRM